MPKYGFKCITLHKEVKGCTKSEEFKCVGGYLILSLALVPTFGVGGAEELRLIFTVENVKREKVIFQIPFLAGNRGHALCICKMHI